MPLKRRNQTPPYFSNYKLYNEYLRQDFNYCCAYCNVCEPEIGGKQSFHIDHYQPKIQFPELENNYSNLFYSCRNCNQYKGRFWPSKEELQLGQFILNPCAHDMEEHLECSEITWRAKSFTGSWNLEKLPLNSPDKQRRRKTRFVIMQHIQQLQIQEMQIKAILERSIEFNRFDKNEIEENLKEINNQLDSYMHMISGPHD